MTETIFETNTETAILSIVLTKPALVYNLENIKDYMFNSIPNRTIWTAIQNIVDQSLIPDAEMVLNELKRTGRLEDAGTSTYIKYLASQVFSSDNLDEYERQLVETYKAVGLITATSGLSDKVSSAESVDEVIDEIRKKLDNLQDTTSTGYSDSLADIADEAYTKIVKRTENPGKVGFTFGIADIDTYTGGLLPTDIWVIAGRPSMGKTAVAMNSILNSAKDGYPCLLLSLESSKQKLIERLIALDLDMPLQDIHLGTLDSKELKKISESLNRLKKLPIYLDTNFSPSLEYVIATIRRMVKQKGVKIVYLDYVQLFSSRGEDDRKEIGRICRSMKLLATQLGIGIVMLAQLNRKCEERDDKRPMLSDLKESGDLEQDADLVAFLYRDYYYNKDTKDKSQLEFLIKKYRDGGIGTIMLKMELTTNLVSCP